MHDNLQARGRYEFWCVGLDGKVKWRDVIENTVVIVGKNLALDTFLAGSAYTATVFMGLISSVGFTVISINDTMTVRSWSEAGGANAPTYSPPRPTLSWAAAAAGSKALSSPAVFGVIGAGTIKGGFIVFGSGATSVIDSTTGVLWSAGLLAGGDQAVKNGDTVNVNYMVSL